MSGRVGRGPWVSKGDRKREATARERIAKMRAEEARRRRRRIWLAATGAAVVIVGAAVAIPLALSGGGSPATGSSPGSSSSPQLKLASLSTLGTLQPSPAPGGDGPEAVPVPWP